MNEHVEGDSLVISSETEMSTNEQKTKPTKKKDALPITDQKATTNLNNHNPQTRFENKKKIKFQNSVH